MRTTTARLAVVVTIAMSLTGVTLARAGAAERAASPARRGLRAVSVPVTVLGGQGVAGGARPVVFVRVGSSPPVPVLLDTGSPGLRIFGDVVRTGPGSGVSVSTAPTSITYAGGHRFDGVVAAAVIHLGSQPTAAPVPFELVQRASCIPTKPVCPASGGIPGFERSGAFGILGIGTQSGGVLNSPILGMPGRLGRTWTIHVRGTTGTLVLGSGVPSGRRVVATIPLRRTGTVGGRTLWADARIPLCLTVGALHSCAFGIFDTGTPAMQISGPAFEQAATVPGTQLVVPGSRVALSFLGAPAPFWNFTSGAIRSRDSVIVHTGAAAFVNTGVQAFYAFRITYDDAHGTLTFVRPR